MQPSDLNSDGIVDVIDLSILVSRWGTSDPDADINSDGTVDALDLSVLVSNWGSVSSGSGTALLVTNESVLSAGNQALHDRLVTLGYSVITRLDSAPVDYSGIDVMVTGSITGSNINGKYAHPDVGLVCVDSWTHFGLGSSIGFQNTVTDIEVINDSSPLAGGLNSGIHTVYGTAGYLVWSTNYNAATATIIATNPGVPTNPIVFAYEAGSEMAGVYATTRHVGLGFHRLVRADTTASGWALFDAAVAWARSTTYVAPPPPSAPTNLSATASDTQVALSWNSVAGATSYTVKRSTVSGGPYSTIVSGHTTTSYTNTGLTNGTTYYYVVSATNAQGESPNSVQVSAVPVEAGGGGGSVYVTASELAVWQDRSVNGPYRSSWPADWINRIEPRALGFSAGGDILPQPTSKVQINDPSPAPEQRVKAREMMACAFYALIKNDANRGAEAAQHLYLQLTTGVDYSDQNIWERADIDGGGHNPWFQYASTAERYANTYKYLQAGGFTDSTLDNVVENWMWHAAALFEVLVSGKNASLESRFNNGSWTTMDGVEPLGARETNNRIMDIANFCCTAGYLGGYPAAVSAAKTFVTNAIRSAYHPDALWWSDIHRGSSISHNHVGYHGSVIGNAIGVADTLRRNGDSDIFNHTSPEGNTFLGWCRMWSRLALGEINDPLGWDSTSRLRNDAPTFIYISQVQNYFNNTTINNALNLSLPTSPQSNGPNTYWEGPSGIWPAVMFKFKDVDPGVA
jgi:hypothetical protein